jgi:DNA-binding IclR family transcriptional regulator
LTSSRATIERLVGEELARSSQGAVLGILVMGPSATFDSSWDGKVAEPLRRCATEVSRRIGRAVAA